MILVIRGRMILPAAVAAAVLGGGLVFADSQDSCKNVSTDLVLKPNQILRLGSVAVELRVKAGGAEGRSIDLDLLVRPLETPKARARSGTYVPGLDVAYELARATGELASGNLDFRLSVHGPAYGTTIPSIKGLRSDPPVLTVTLDRRYPDPYETASACPSMPLSLRFEVDDLEPGEPQEPAGLRTPADNLRIDELGTLDPRPSEDYSDIWGYESGGNQFAIMGSSQGTLFIDVSDPANPTEVGDISGPTSSWRDIKTYQNYAYIVTEGFGGGQGMQIVDLSNPFAPSLASTYNQTFVTGHNIYIDVANGMAWIVGSNAGTRILDLSDPVNPVEVGSWSVRYVHDAYVTDDFACLSEINSGRQELANVAVPSNLQILSSWFTPDTATHNCWANEARTFVVTTDERNPGGHLAIYDISSPAGPIPKLGEYDPNPSAIVHNAILDDQDDERVAMSYYNLGFKLVDVHRPGVPLELASYDTRASTDNGFGGAWGVYPFDSRGYYYISDIQSGLFVLRYLPTGGVLSGIVSSAATGDPIPNARVIILPEGLIEFTASDGLYSTYANDQAIQLRVSAPGFATRVLSAGSLPFDGRLDADAELSPLPVAPVSGFVRRSGDLSGIEGATVNVVSRTFNIKTGPSGEFTLPAVAVGQQVLTAEAFGYNSNEKIFVAGPGIITPVEVILSPAMFADDVETDLAWTLGVPGDGAVAGAWVRVDPNGTAGGTVQPEDDNTLDPAVTAFVTGQGPPGGDVESFDVDRGVTTLMSPLIDLQGLGAVKLRYNRWLSNDAGDIVPGGSMRTQVSSDDGSSWTTIELLTANANSWIESSFDVESSVPLTDEFRVRFRAEPSEDFEWLKVLECGVDDVDIVQACLAQFNPKSDVDTDGTIDVCDGCPDDPANDTDGDGICGEIDNAPFNANPNQDDGDSDGVGDAGDNCVADANPDQRDLTGDGEGDACDPDIDGDGILNAADDDQDNDGVPDLSDLCPSTPDRQLDSDDDGEGDACDPDDGLVQGLRMDGTLLIWEPEADADAYNLYRGELGADLFVSLSDCRIDGTTATFSIDTEAPVLGDGFVYLVSRTAGGAEGSLGLKSDGRNRLVDVPCP